MELKDRVRRCYAEEISLKENDFVKMLCLDGIFIIEFLRKRSMAPELNRYDNIFEMDWLIGTIERDLILFENQIPFFVLLELFDMTKSDGEDNLIDLALPVCQVPFDPSRSCTSISAIEVIHLLDLRHKIACSSFDAILNDPKNDDDLQHKSWCSSFDAILEKITGVKTKDIQNKCLPELKSTSQLRQSGIKFESTQPHPHTSWLHITFKNGKLKIPHLTVDDYTESVFRNLIAFEQYMTGSHRRKFITNYATFLDDLIDSPSDVEELCQYQILTNYLGDDEDVATMFNKLVLDVTFGDFSYSKVYEEVNKHADRRWNIWKAHLMRNYFNTPWSVISFLAAVVLLIFTFVQTIFSILAVCKTK